MGARLVTMIMLVLPILGCAGTYDDSDLVDRISELERSVAALAAVTPAPERVVVIAKEDRDTLNLGGSLARDQCVIYKVLDVQREKCHLFYLPISFDQDGMSYHEDQRISDQLSEYNDNMLECLNEIVVGREVPDCWW